MLWNFTNNDLIPEELTIAIKSLPPKSQQLILQAISVSKSHSGPLPDSETIKIYNEVIPNGGDRLMSTVEKQVEHRITLENIGLKRSFNQSSTGQWIGFIIALFFGYLSYDLIVKGHELAGTIIGSIDLVSLVAVFVIKGVKTIWYKI